MTAPFGIAFYAPLLDLEVLAEVGEAKAFVKAPTPHPLFEQYLVQATASLGVVWVKGIAPAIDNDRFGTAARTAVDRVAEQLTQRYGPPEKMDFLMEGSIWGEPQDWMNALNDRERFYSYSWERPRARQLPEDIESIYVGASPFGVDAASVVLEYSSPKMKAAAAELERQMAELL